MVKDGYLSFARELLQERKMMGLPPHSHAALIRCEGKTLAATTQTLKDTIAILPNGHNLAVLGPIDAPMSKKNSRYHVHLLLLGKDRQQLIASGIKPVVATCTYLAKRQIPEADLGY